MNIPVCVRNGCETGNIQIGRFVFEMDLTELLEIVGAARLELRDSLLLNRDKLDTALRHMQEILHIEMRNSQKPTDSDNAKNLKRWQATGCGGYTNLNKICDIILKDRRDQKALHEARELERDIAWQAVRKEKEAAWVAARMEEGERTTSFKLKSMQQSRDLLVCHEDSDCSKCKDEKECITLTEAIDKLVNA